MPEFQLINQIRDTLAPYPGKPELSEWIKKSNLPISTRDDLYAYNNALTIFLDRNRSFRSSSTLRFSFDKSVKADKNVVLKNEKSLFKEVVEPIDKYFGRLVKETGPIVTLPLQLQSWEQNHLTEWTNCQMPLLFLKIVLGKLDIDHEVGMGIDVPHPYIFIPKDETSMFKVHFVAGGQEITALDRSTLNRRLRESWAFLNDDLSMMRFIDYTSVITKLVDESQKLPHGSSDQYRHWDMAIDAFEQMSGEFGNIDSLEKYWNTYWVNRSKDD